MTQYFNPKSSRVRRRELRSEMPPAEVMLWSRIRSRQVLNCKFRRQHGVGPFSLDFYSPEIKLAIELDGDSHFLPGAAEADRRRQQFVESLGIRFIRFLNTDVLGNLDGVLEELASQIAARRALAGETGEGGGVN